MVDERREVTRINDHNLISITCRVDNRRTGRRRARVKTTNGYKAASIARENIRRIEWNQSRLDHESMKGTILNGIQRASREVKQKDRSIFTSHTIRKIVAEKKAANKEWRKASKRGELSEMQ